MQEAPEHPVKACQIHRGVPFVFQAEQGILSGRPKGAALLEALMAHLQLSQDNTAIALDFKQVQFVDVSCADQVPGNPDARRPHAQRRRPRRPARPISIILSWKPMLIE